MVGTIIIILLPELLRSSNVEWLKFMQKWYLVFFGVAVVALMIWLPGGILSFGDRFKAKGACQMSAASSKSRTCARQYGAIKAVDGVSFNVGPGEIVGVIGPNGSGKTTLFNSILGQIKPTSGSVAFCGEDITGMSPLELSRRGVGRTFQTLQVFGKLSVRDNLIAAAQEFKGTLGVAPARAKPDAGLGEHADEMIELFRLKHVAHLPAGTCRTASRS